MNKIYHTVFFIAFVGFFASASGQHMVFYSNEEDGYSLKFPEDWRRLENFDSQLSLVALAPEETEAEDGVRESLNVAVFNSEKKTVEIFYAQYKASHEKQHRSWKLSGEGELLSRASNALLFSCYYSDTKSNRTHGEVVYIYRSGEKIAVLTCTSSFDELESYKATFDKIAQSFSFELAPAE